MFFAVFGVPTSATHRALKVLMQLVGTTGAGYNLFGARTVHEFAAAWGRREKRKVVFFHESPTGEITSFFGQSELPVLLILDDPLSVQWSLCSERSLEPLNAMRTASVCFSALEPLLDAQRLLIIDAGDRAGLSFRAFIETIARHFDLEPTSERIELVLLGLKESGEVASDVCATDSWLVGIARREHGDGLSNCDDSFDTCLSPFRSLLDGRKVSHFTWPAEVFLSMDRGGQPATGMVELAGPKRIVLYGPYLGLPRAVWDAHIQFEVSGNKTGCVMQANVISGGFLAQGRFELPERGRHECNIIFDICEPSWPVEIHFTLDHGVIDGMFGVLRVDIERVDNF